MMRHVAGERAVSSCRVSSSRPFDLKHFGTVVPEHFCAVRSGDVPGQVKDAETYERLHLS